MYDAGAIVFNIRAAGAQIFRQEMSEADKAAERLGKTSETASSKTEELGKKQETAAEKARRLAKAQAEAEAAARDYAAAQDAVGKVLVTAGAAIVATTGLAVKSAIDWQSAWAGVTKTVDGTDEELDTLETGLRDLTKVLPASHTEIAAVAEAAGQLGVKTKDVVGFTRTMIDLGETTNLSSDQAATALAQLMNIMGTAGEDVDRLGSTIVALGNDGASTEAEIVSMAQRIAGSGKLVGATEGEVLALSNALASMGVTAELGGGVASRILQDLYSAVQTGGDRLEAFAAVAGVSAQDFATAFKNDPVRAMGAFATGLNGIEASGGNVVQTLTDLGFKSTEEQRILLQLKSAGDLLTDSLELQSSAWEENSALTDEAAKRYETVESKLGIMRNRINDAAIDLGSVFLPALADGAEVVGDFADGIASLPEPIQQVIAGGTLMAGVVALLGGTALIAVPKVAALWGQIQLLAATGTPLTAGLGKAAAFLTSGWGLALLAATTAITIFQSKIDETKASTEEFQNIIANSKSVGELFAATESDLAIFSRLDEAIADADTFRSKLDIIANNDFLRGLDGAASTLKGSLQDIGKQLATTADTDLPSAQRAFRMLSEEYNLNAEEQGWLLDTMGEYKSALVDVANQQGINVTSSDKAANAAKLLELAYGDTTPVVESASEAYQEQASSVQSLTDELTGLIETINEANGVAVDAITANADYLSALDGLTAMVEKNGTTLDENTVSGSANAAALGDLSEKARDAAQAQFEQDLAMMSADDAAKKWNSTLGAQKQAFIDSAIAAGYNEDEVRGLADRIFQLPAEKDVAILVETAEAQRRITAIQAALNAVRSATAIISAIPSANGNVIEAYANGGVRENHVAQMARAGAMRVWAEPETGGESYIPHAPSKRARSEQLMSETAEILGGTYIPAGSKPFADGSAVAASPPGIGIREGDQFVFVIEGTPLTATARRVADQRGAAVRRDIRDRRRPDA